MGDGAEIDNDSKLMTDHEMDALMHGAGAVPAILPSQYARLKAAKKRKKPKTAKAKKAAQKKARAKAAAKKAVSKEAKAKTLAAPKADAKKGGEKKGAAKAAAKRPASKEEKAKKLAAPEAHAMKKPAKKRKAVKSTGDKHVLVRASTWDQIECIIILFLFKVQNSSP